jgi:cysteine-rich repeat protein
MNCKFLRWLLILPTFLVLASCGSKGPEPKKDVPNSAAQSATEQPIEVIVKKGNSGADVAPVEPIVVDVPAAVPVGPAPVGPVGPVGPIGPPPIPVGVVVDDTCEDIFCGDGHKQEGEECDDGNDETDDNCDNFCRKIRCGNGRVEGEEECDNPDNIHCTEDCILDLCGNGEVDAGETCDPPNEETECNATCLTSICGNGIVEFGEECDDANEINSDGCNSDCELICSPPVTRNNP